ncbi:MAG: response regulator [Planctomycetaceae bacterium]|nr:response regulator [Planctomycetaceae bacterium]
MGAFHHICSCPLATVGESLPGWLQISGDVSIALASIAVPAVMAWLALRREQARLPLAVWLLLCLSPICASVYLLEVANFRWEFFSSEAIAMIKLGVAVAVWITFGMLMILFPQVLAWPRLTQLTADLQTEIVERTRTENQLKESLCQLAEAQSGLEMQAIRLELQNQQLQEANELADAANRAKSDFLANMSHEIRTPMTAILGYVEVLRDENRDRPATLDALATIHRNGWHLLQIINDILDLSKIESGKLTVETIPCAPLDVVGEVVSLMRPRAVEKGIQFSFSADGPLPALIHSDPTRLRQILLNLVSNAIKFTRQGEVRLTARLLPEGPSRVEFEISDTGKGMTPTEMQRLFNPFTQADSSITRNFGGTGLGLAISQRLARILGGAIQVESQPDLGSCFRVTIATGPIEGIPLRVQADLATTETAPQAVAPAARLACRVLLAEDGPDNQRLIAHLLTKAGAEVEVVENGQLAVDQALTAAAQGRPFDLILMDMQMPVLDGYSATRQLRTRGYTRPIVALTAHAMQGDREKCLAAGCDGFATKPIDRRMLIEVVARYAEPNAAQQLLPAAAPVLAL